MIRPITLATMLLAGGAGLYVYQIKHQAQMLDREIARTVRATDMARERIGMLRAEWALLQEPEALAKLTDQHLALRTLQPSQFVPVNELAARLPSPLIPGTPAPSDDVTPLVAVPMAQLAPRPPLMVTNRPAAQASPAPAPIPAPTRQAAAQPTQAAPARPAAPSGTAQNGVIQSGTAQASRPTTHMTDAAPIPVPAAPPASHPMAPVLLTQATSLPVPPRMPQPPTAVASAPIVPATLPVPPAASRPVLAPVLSVMARPMAASPAPQATAPQPSSATIRDAQPSTRKPPARAAQSDTPARAARAERTERAEAVRTETVVPANTSALGMARVALPPPVPVGGNRLPGTTGIR